MRETHAVASISESWVDCSGTALGGSWSLLASANRESAYHDRTLLFFCFHHVSDGQKRDKEDRVGRRWETAGAWGRKQYKRLTGLMEWQEEGRTAEWNDMVRDERTEKEGQKVGAKRPGQPELKCSDPSPCPCHLLLCPSASFFAFWPSTRHPSPTSQPLLTTNPPLSHTRETDLLLPSGAHTPPAPALLGAPIAGEAIPSGAGFLGLWYCNLYLQNLLSSHSSGHCQDALSLWTRSSRSGQRRAKSETPD